MLKASSPCICRLLKTRCPLFVVFRLERRISSGWLLCFHEALAVLEPLLIYTRICNVTLQQSQAFLTTELFPTSQTWGSLSLSRTKSRYLETAQKIGIIGRVQWLNLPSNDGDFGTILVRELDYHMPVGGLRVCPWSRNFVTAFRQTVAAPTREPVNSGSPQAAELGAPSREEEPAQIIDWLSLRLGRNKKNKINFQKKVCI